MVWVLSCVVYQIYDFWYFFFQVFSSLLRISVCNDKIRTVEENIVSNTHIQKEYAVLL